MARIYLMDGNDVDRVMVEGSEPFVFLLRRPIVFRRRDIVIGFGRSLLESARRVHRSKRSSAAILRRFFHPRSNLRRNRDQPASYDEFPDLLEIFADIAKQTLRNRVLALNLFEYFSRRFVPFDLVRCRGKDLLFLP